MFPASCFGSASSPSLSRKQIARRSAGFTLIEIMVATAITLILMASVATMFGFVTTSVTDSRAMAEANERLRNVRNLLQHDLQGITAYGTPPLSPDMSRGYLEYIEGPVGPLWRPGNGYPGVSALQTYLSPWDDCDDILMFTTRSTAEPYLGRFYDIYGHYNVIASPTAEVAWFARGTTLFRRVLLVLPNENVNLMGGISATSTTMPYYWADISMRQEGGSLYNYSHLTSAGAPVNPRLYANSLSDLTKRENRYGHQPLAWPYDARFWNWPTGSTGSGSSLQGTGILHVDTYGTPNVIGLPTLQECSSSAFPLPFYGPETPAYSGTSRQSSQYASTLFGYYILPNSNASNPSRLGKNNNPAYYPYHWELLGGTANPDPIAMTTDTHALNTFFTQTNGQGLMNMHYGQNPPRFDDVVLTGVIGFDVKIWDPGAPVFQVAGNIGGMVMPTSVAPGDPYYYTALQRFYSNASPSNTNATLGGVGAYVDLNYMLAPQGNSTNVGLANYFEYYLTALNNYENNTLVKATTPVSGLTTFPGYIIPRPRFATEGDLPIYGGGGTNGPLYGYMGCPPIMRGLPGLTSSGVRLNNYQGAIASVYDTWSTHYESDGVDQDQDGLIDEGTDGIDNPYVIGTAPMNGPWRNVATITTGAGFLGGVDDPSELEAPPPYATTCKGLQIRIRIIEPGSRQIREVTVIQELLDE